MPSPNERALTGTASLRPVEAHDAVVDVAHLVKTYAGKPPVRAVRDVSFQVERGEIFGFLGPNGAGKTTTIRCMLDMLRPTSGRIAIFGLDAQRRVLDIHRRVGYLPG